MDGARVGRNGRRSSERDTLVVAGSGESARMDLVCLPSILPSHMPLFTFIHCPLSGRSLRVENPPNAFFWKVCHQVDPGWGSGSRTCAKKT